MLGRAASYNTKHEVEHGDCVWPAKVRNQKLRIVQPPSKLSYLLKVYYCLTIRGSISLVARRLARGHSKLPNESTRSLCQLSEVSLVDPSRSMRMQGRFDVFSFWDWLGSGSCVSTDRRSPTTFLNVGVIMAPWASEIYSGQYYLEYKIKQAGTQWMWYIVHRVCYAVPEYDLLTFLYNGILLALECLWPSLYTIGYI